MQKPDYTQLAVGDPVMLYRSYRRGLVVAKVKKVGRIWLEVSPVDFPSDGEQVRRSDGRSKSGYSWIHTLAEHEDLQRRAEVERSLREAGISISGHLSTDLLVDLAAAVARHQEG